MAEPLQDVFKRKCQDLACEPVQAVVDDMVASAEQRKPLSVLMLNGNSKRLFNKRIQFMQVFALCETLYEDPHIRTINLSYNNLNDTAAGALARLIRMNKSLQFIDLTGNDVTKLGASDLAEALEHSDVVLQGLVLAGNPLGDTGVLRLADMLRVNKSLKLLDLGSTGMGVQGIIGLASALGESAGHSPLESLDLENPVLPVPQEATVQHLSRMLACNTSLRELGLAKHALTDDTFETLVQYGLLPNNSITSLNLRGNRLSAFAGPTLERLLAEKHTLSRVNLASNTLGKDGALSISRALPYSHWLTHVDLRNNRIGELGLVALAEALALASHVKEFMIWGNPFGPSASRAFYDALSAAPPGLVTDLTPYQVDNEAMIALKDE